MQRNWTFGQGQGQGQAWTHIESMKGPLEML